MREYIIPNAHFRAGRPAPRTRACAGPLRLLRFAAAATTSPSLRTFANIRRRTSPSAAPRQSLQLLMSQRGQTG